MQCKFNIVLFPQAPDMIFVDEDKRAALNDHAFYNMIVTNENYKRKMNYLIPGFLTGDFTKHEGKIVEFKRLAL